MKYITIKEATTQYLRISQEYVAPSFCGKSLMHLPEVDLRTIFGNRKRMDVDKLTAEICNIIVDHISKQ